MLKIKVNHLTRNKVLIPGKLFFAGGNPAYRILPQIARWGSCTSIFWLDTELIWKYRKSLKDKFHSKL